MAVITNMFGVQN